MPRFDIKKYGTYIFAAAGCITAGVLLKIVIIKITLIIGAALVVYSVPAFYVSFENSRRAEIIISVSSFFTGTILLLISWYEILNPVKILFPSLLFITGMVFIFLYADNKKEKLFLYTGILTTAAGFCIVLFYKHLPYIYQAERVIYVLSDYWYVLAVGTGLFLLFNRENK